MASKKTKSTSVPVGGTSSRGYSSLPEDNIKTRIGISVVVSISANFLLLYGASAMANNMTITQPGEDKNIDRSVKLTIEEPSPTPKATPTPEPTPPPREATPRPTPQPERKVVPPTPVPTPEPKQITERPPSTPPPTPPPTPNVTEATPQPTPAPVTPTVKTNTEASRPVQNPNPEIRNATNERPVNQPERTPSAARPNENNVTNEAATPETPEATGGIARDSSLRTPGKTGASKSAAESVAAKVNNSAEAIEAGVASRPGATSATNPATPSRNPAATSPAGTVNAAASDMNFTSDISTPTRQNQKVSGSTYRTTGRPRIITMDANAARVTRTENVALEGGSLRPGEATVRPALGTSAASTATAKVAAVGIAGTNNVSVDAPGAMRGTNPSVMGKTTAAKSKIAGGPSTTAAKTSGQDGVGENTPGSPRGNSTVPTTGFNGTGRPNAGTPGGDGTVTAANGVGNLPDGAPGVGNNRDIKGTPSKGVAKSKTGGFGTNSGKETQNEAPGFGGTDTRTQGGGNIAPGAGGRDKNGNPAGQESVSGTNGTGIETGTGSPINSGKGEDVKQVRPNTASSEVRESDRPARKKSGATPSVPDELRTEQFSASITARFDISSSGRSTVRLTKGSGNSAIDRYVLSVLSRWSWEPSYKNGKPVDTEQTVQIQLSVN